MKQFVFNCFLNWFQLCKFIDKGVQPAEVDLIYPALSKRDFSRDIVINIEDFDNIIATV